jgi:hypothetical protein
VESAWNLNKEISSFIKALLSLGRFSIGDEGFDCLNIDLAFSLFETGLVQVVKYLCFVKFSRAILGNIIVHAIVLVFTSTWNNTEIILVKV